MFVEAAPQAKLEEEPASDSASDTDESVSDVLRDLTLQMKQIDETTKTLDTTVLALYQRVKLEAVDWMKEPLRPKRSIQAWCTAHGLSATPSMDEFADACLLAARSVDLNSRILTFAKEDAAILWNGMRRLTVFDMIRLIPTLFE